MQADVADAIDLLVAAVMVMPGEDRQHFSTLLQQGANVRCVLNGMGGLKKGIDLFCRVQELMSQKDDGQLVCFQV